MRPIVCIVVLFVLAAAGCHSVEPEPPMPRVRVLLNDGQVLVGELATRTFTLRTGIGTFNFDTAHAGELGPLEGKDVDASDRMIRLWLKNGSEFVGQWKKPGVRVVLSLGGRHLEVDVPIRKVRRLQFMGRDVWPTTPVFRIVTRSGDDFFVDVTRTQFTFANELGRFRPYLSEINRLEPLDRENKSWRILLTGGMVFNAAIADPKLQLTLAMGPDNISLPLAEVSRMDRQQLRMPEGRGYPGGRTDDGGLFYSNAAQQEAKELAARNWKKER